MITWGVVTLRDLGGLQCQVIIDRIKSKESVKELADFLEQHSSAQILTYEFIQQEFYRGKEAQETGHYDRCDQQLHCIYLDQEGKKTDFLLPAPDENLIDADQEATSEAASAIANLIANITTRTTLYYRGGGLISQI